MQLLKLQIENVGKIRAGIFEFVDGHLTQIKGANRAGKSTILDSIMYLLVGKNAIPSGVITDGEDKATIRGVVDNYHIQRVIKDDGKSTLKITTDEGLIVGSPQKFLDSISSKFLDPTDLVNLSGKECRSKVMQFLGVDTSSLDEEIKQLEVTRTEVGRRGKALGTVEKVKEVERVNVSELYEQLKEIERFNIEQSDRGDDIRQSKEDMQQVENDIELLQGQLEDYKATLASLPEPQEEKDTSKLEHDIQSADETNQKATDYFTYLRKSEAIVTERNRYKELSDKLKAKRDEKTATIMTAMKGLEGIELTDDSVTVDGHTWERLSTSEALEVATNLCMKITPENGIKTLFIKRGESILSEARQRIVELAEKNEFHVIMEVATEQKPSEEPNTFFIVEGEIYED